MDEIAVTGELAVVYAAILGAAVGSFLNVCIARLPAGESVISPRSRCPGCGTAIAWHDNLPLVSWLWLRGRCRHCGESISPVYPAVELAGVLVWAGMAWAYGPSWEALRGAVLLSLVLAIGVVDARHYVIPDPLSVGGVGAGLALAVLPGGPDLWTALAGAATGFAVLWAVAWAGEKVFRKPAMGGGDIKMMAMVGAFLGPVGALMTIFLGAAAGSLIFGPVSLKTGKLVPFGVFLALGSAIAFLFGDALLGWYLGLF